MLGRKPCGCALEYLPHLIELNHLCSFKSAHGKGTAKRDLGETTAYEAAESLPHWCAAHSKFGGDSILGEWIALTKLGVTNSFKDLLVGLIGVGHDMSVTTICQARSLLYTIVSKLRGRRLAGAFI
jgi:hypothetical protein